MRAIQYDVSRVERFAQKQSNDLKFKVVCGDEFAIVTNPSMSLFVCALMMRNMASAKLLLLVNYKVQALLI